jgi:hypothetical protein
MRRLEELKDQKLYDQVVLIQKNVKRLVAQVRWQRMRSGAFKFQALWKGYKQRNEYLATRKAVVLAQARCRGWSARKATKQALKDLKAKRNLPAPKPVGSTPSNTPLPPPASTLHPQNQNQDQNQNQNQGRGQQGKGKENNNSGKKKGNNKQESGGALDALSMLRPEAAVEKDRLADPELMSLLRLLSGVKPGEDVDDAVLDQLGSVLASATKVVAAARGRLAASKRMTQFTPTNVLDNIRKLNPGKSVLLQKIQEQKAR